MHLRNSRAPRNDQLNLFPEILVAGANAPPYYRGVPEHIVPHACKLRSEVLAEFVASGDRGLTADQAASAINESVLAVRPRVSELACGGLLAATGERRRNQSGLFANVLRVTQAGLDEYRRRQA
jgi:hypothetical protein